MIEAKQRASRRIGRKHFERELKRFDLTLKKAKGETKSNNFPAGDKRGWFFVLQEVPGEPRFGMDIAYEPSLKAGTSAKLPNTWNNLAWNSFTPPEPAFVKSLPAPSLPPPHDADLTLHPWAKNSAEMAYVLFQTPVMVAVHTSEMLDMKPAT